MKNKMMYMCDLYSSWICKFSFVNMADESPLYFGSLSSENTVTKTFQNVSLFPSQLLKRLLKCSDVISILVSQVTCAWCRQSL